VALERASQAKELLTKMLTAEQIEEAHKEASAKLSQPEAEVSSDLQRSSTSAMRERNDP
jgi:hypothetical protein